MRRLIAIFFLFAFAGQILGGDCACLKADAKDDRDMACCKRDKSGAKNVSRPPCCISSCKITGGNTIPVTRSESLQKNFGQAILILEPVQLAGILRPIPETFSLIRNLPDDTSTRRARSPDLFLRYHSIRI